MPGGRALLAVALIAFAACDAQTGLAPRVVALGGETLPTATRLYGSTTYPVCRRAAVDPLAGCDTDPPLLASAHRDLLADVHGAPAGRDSADVTHARILIDLVWAVDEETAAHAIARLQPLTATQDSVVFLNDLAVAWELKARFSGRVADWTHALDYAERAAAAEQTPIPLLNRAVLLERFRMNSLALEAWGALAAHADAGIWKAEADARIRSLRTARSADAVAVELEALLADRDTAGFAALRTTAFAFPQIARRFATVRALPAWVHARRSADTSAAAHIAAVVTAIGEGIALRSGDTSIATEAAALRANAVPDRIAEAYLAYAAAEESFDSGRFEEMADQAARAASLADFDESVVTPWAVYALGMDRVMNNDLPAGDSIFVAILEDPTTANRHSLRGRALWGRGLMAARGFRGGSALAFYRDASEALGRSFEAEYTAAMSALMVEQYARSGDRLQAWDRLGEAIQALEAHRSSIYLANAYRRASDMAAQAGLPHAALAFQREGLAVARATKRVQQPIEASTSLGLRLAQLGHGLEASSVWNEAAASLTTVPDPAMRERLAADLRNARTTAALLPGLRAGGNASIDSISRTLEYFRARNLGSATASLLHQRAEAYLIEGDTAAAQSDLEAALALLVTALRDLGAPQRLPLESAGRTIERLTQILAAKGETERALAVSDIARAVQLGEYDIAGTDAVELPAGRTVMAITSLPDELLVWYSDRRGLRVEHRSAARAALADSIAAFHSHLQRGLEPARSSAGSWLARVLFPDDEAIPPALTIVTDATLGSLAFSALPVDGETLLLDRTILQSVPSLRQLAMPADRGAGRGSVLLLAGSGDPDAGLPELPHARAEIDAIASFRPDAQAATSDSDIPAALAGASLFHFAGHTVIGDSPLDSRLVLKSSGSPGERYLRATDLGTARFPLLETVILSSCRTLDAGASPSAGLSAFAAAFMRAGASTLVGTLWPIDDRAAVDLMVAFHRRLSAGMPAPEALALSQREARAAGSPVQPGLWAAFTILTR